MLMDSTANENSDNDNSKPKPEIFQNLNSKQKEATIHRDGPILVLAGAGSGKTRVLTRRIAYLISTGVAPDNILAVTFTNKATAEMKERLRVILGSVSNSLWVATFHSACLRILRRHAKAINYNNDFVIYDDKDSDNLIKGILKEMKIDAPKDVIRNYKRIISDAKNHCLSHKSCLKRLAQDKTAFAEDVFEHYQRALHKANAMDFDDLLLNTVILLNTNPEILSLYQRALHYILIDEFQDTNRVQYEFIQLISKPRNNLFVVGDDDQSIYAFRGADSSHILNFNKKDYPEATVVKLEQNYRSTANILNAANAVIVKNTTRQAKSLWTDGKDGSKIKTYSANDENDEATFIARKIKSKIDEKLSLNEIALFYRTNAQSRALEEALNAYGIPYRIYGGLKFYDRKEVKDILAYLKLIQNTSDNQAYLRVVNNPPRGIGLQSIQNVVNFARENDSTLYEATKELSQSNAKLKVFYDLMESFIQISETEFASVLIEKISTESGYLARLKNLKDGSSQSRIENLDELKGVARRSELLFSSPKEALGGFLDRIALTSSIDEAAKDTTDGGNNENQELPEAVTLMTLHMAKGLEYEMVFLTGFEQGLLPHSRTLMNLTEIEEERRLCYVGMTRAKKELYLTKTKFRSMFTSGSSFGISGQYREVSQFYFDIPANLLKDLGSGFAEDGGFSDSDEDENLEFGINNIFGKKKKSKSITANNILKFIKPAEKLLNTGFDPSPIEDIKLHSNIEHQHFGKGKVTEFIEHKSGDAKKRKVIVFFYKFEASRILILDKARLRVVD